MEPTWITLIVLPVGLGLLGFVEPCTIGSSLLFIKYLEGKTAARQRWQTGLFVLTRALFIGTLGAVAALVGSAFLHFQKGAWVVLGAAYALIGGLYLVGKAGLLMQTLGPSLARLRDARGSMALGVLFGFNIPACAAPLIFAVLGTAALDSSDGHVLRGFISLALFGLALSLPLALLVLAPAGRTVLDWLARRSARIPFWIGVVFLALGLWSVYFGLFVTLEDWQ